MGPLFFHEETAGTGTELVLTEEASKHMVQVLRMEEGAPLQLTNGRGSIMDAVISKPDRRKCLVHINHITHYAAPHRRITLGISLLKNAARLEWLLEKATEIGVSVIIPLLCARTERSHWRADRMRSIMVSALLQSQQAWLPEISDPQAFDKCAEAAVQQQRFIAHCLHNDQPLLQDLINANLESQIILIGPEGDFTREEIDLALANKFLPVSLGTHRLRTETAGLVALTMLNME